MFDLFLVMGLAVIYAAVLLYMLRKEIQKEKRLSQSTGSLERKPAVFGKIHQGFWAGFPYEYHYYQGSDKTSSAFTVRAQCHSATPFSIYAEKPAQVFFKKIQISSEIQTQDPEFDKAFYIESDAKDFMKAFLGAPERRRAVQEIFRLGFNHLRQSREMLEISIMPLKSTEEVDANVIHEAVKNLRVLIAGMPQNVWPREGSYKQKRTAVKVITWSFCAVALYSTYVEHYKPLDEVAFDALALKTGLGLFVLIFGWAVVMLKGRSDSHRHLIFAFILGLLGVVLLPVGFY